MSCESREWDIINRKNCLQKTTFTRAKSDSVRAHEDQARNPRLVAKLHMTSWNVRYISKSSAKHEQMFFTQDVHPAGSDLW